jgi:RsiW-degrading membrane proteinase PrsW (M82 family)
MEIIIESVIRFGAENKLLLLSLLGGVFPCLIWMIFWLKEDECEEIVDHAGRITYICEPEPKSLIFSAFIFGGLLIPIALFFETLVYPIFSGLVLVAVWATIEELLKFGLFVFAFYATGKIKSPIDSLVYLSVIAVGFSAFENSLYLYQSLTNSHSLSATLIGQNYRFLGASILHVISSGIIGLLWGFAFYSKKIISFFVVLVGVVLSIVLHSFFNYLIIIREPENTLQNETAIWGIGIAFLLGIEGLRYFAKKKKIALLLNTN